MWESIIFEFNEIIQFRPMIDRSIVTRLPILQPRPKTTPSPKVADLGIFTESSLYVHRCK
jgi:hypothetical protein